MRPRQKLLILAASVYQIPFIEAARKFGCEVLTVDNRPDNPGHALADRSFHCDTTDVDALVELARRECIDGVVAAATDVALDGAAAIGATLGLPGATPTCVATLTRKLAFRELQARLALPHPYFTDSISCAEFGPAQIVKPNRASGSKGVRIVTDADQLQAAWSQAQRESIDRTAMIESLIPGQQGTIEGVMHEGRISASMVTDRSTAAAPAVGTRSHRVPAAFPTQALDALHEQIECVFSFLQYRNGPFDADFVHGANGVVVLIELTPRAGGNSLVRLMKHAADFDMPAYVVDTALGKPVGVKPFRIQPAAVEILGVETSGIIEYDAVEIARIKAMPSVAFFHMDRPPGAFVQAFVDGRHRVGELVVVSDSATGVEMALAEAHHRLRLRVLP